MKIQCDFVSAHGHSVFRSLRTMGWISISLYAHSRAVRLTSPLPCRQWESPVQIRPPLRNTGKYRVDPACNSFTSMFEPFFHGRNVLVRPRASRMGGPALGGGSFGSTPTANFPGKGLRSTTIPGLNSVVMLARFNL